MDRAESSSERQRLLGSGSDPVDTNRPSCRHFLLLPSLFLTNFGGQLCLYVLNEWTQHQIAVKHFKDTHTNFSSCSMNSSNPDYIKHKDIERETATWLNIYSAAELIPVMIMQLYLPSYTDYIGRKFLIVLATLGLCIKAVGVTVCVRYDANFLYMVIPLVLSGCTGTFFALLSASFSFLADLTFSPKHRTTALVVCEAVLLLSSSVGIPLSGYFIETINLRFFYTSLIGSILSGLSLILVILTPESLPNHRRTQQQSVWRTIKRMTDFYISPEFRGHRKTYILLLLAFVVTVITNINRANMEMLYFLGQPFCWGPAKIGIYALVQHVSLSAACFTAPLLQRCMSNMTIAIMSNVTNAVSYIIEAFAKTTLVVYIVPVAGIFSLLVVPMIRGLMSSMTPSDKQGALFASVSTLEVVSTLIGGLSQNAIYTFTVSFMNGFVFIIFAVLCVITIILLAIYNKTRYGGPNYEILVGDGASRSQSSLVQNAGP